MQAYSLLFSLHKTFIQNLIFGIYLSNIIKDLIFKLLRFFVLLKKGVSYEDIIFCFYMTCLILTVNYLVNYVLIILMYQNQNLNEHFLSYLLNVMYLYAN